MVTLIKVKVISIISIWIETVNIIGELLPKIMSNFLRFFVPYLCQIEVKTNKNIHKQIKPNKNWNLLGIKKLRCNLMHH